MSATTNEAARAVSRRAAFSRSVKLLSGRAEAGYRLNNAGWGMIKLRFGVLPRALGWEMRCGVPSMVELIALGLPGCIDARGPPRRNQRQGESERRSKRLPRHWNLGKAIHNEGKAMMRAARFAVFLLVGVLSACASGAKVDQMVAAPTNMTAVTQASPLHQAIAVGRVGGGKETNPMWTSQVSNPDFTEALRLSLLSHGMLGQSEGSPYVLDAELKELDQPMFGLTFDVGSTVKYTLRDRRAGSALMDEDIAATGRATVSDAFSAVERLRISNERSIKNNIQNLMLRLDRIKPNAVPVS